jgi:hypothetical protein
MKSILVLFLFIGSISGCEQAEDEQGITAKNLEKQLAGIHSVINADSCSETGECNFLAYGSKACGRPQLISYFQTTLMFKSLPKWLKNTTKLKMHIIKSLA